MRCPTLGKIERPKNGPRLEIIEVRLDPAATAEGVIDRRVVDETRRLERILERG